MPTHAEHAVKAINFEFFKTIKKSKDLKNGFGILQKAS
jgi:hypothetical protein